MSCLDKNTKKIRIELKENKADMAIGAAEIKNAVAAVAAANVGAVKFVGSDPVRFGGLSKLVKEVKSIEGINEVSLTTDGHGLAEKAKELADAGLDRVNINLDTLKYAKYEGDDLDDIVTAINASTDAGLKPVRLNYEAFLWADVKKGLPPLSPAVMGEDGKAADDPREGTADVYKYPGALGKICFIEKRAADFADRCAAFYLSADGILKKDENDEKGIDIKTDADDDAKLADALKSILK